MPPMQVSKVIFELGKKPTKLNDKYSKWCIPIKFTSDCYYIENAKQKMYDSSITFRYLSTIEDPSGWKVTTPLVRTETVP